MINKNIFKNLCFLISKNILYLIIYQDLASDISQNVMQLLDTHLLKQIKYQYIISLIIKKKIIFSIKS